MRGMSGPAAIVLTVLLAALAVFQVALVAGAPLGRFAWGGGERVLSRRKRVGSVVAVVLYAAFAVLALFRAGVVGFLAEAPAIVVAMWVVVAYLAIGIVLNVMSRSLPERAVMTPVVLVLTGLALVVALGL